MSTFKVVYPAQPSPGPLQKKRQREGERERERDNEISHVGSDNLYGYLSVLWPTALPHMTAENKRAKKPCAPSSSVHGHTVSKPTYVEWSRVEMDRDDTYRRIVI